LAKYFTIHNCLFLTPQKTLNEPIAPINYLKLPFAEYAPIVQNFKKLTNDQTKDAGNLVRLFIFVEYKTDPYAPDS
jgi:hypothetical protein